MDYKHIFAAWRIRQPYCQPSLSSTSLLVPTPIAATFSVNIKILIMVDGVAVLVSLNMVLVKFRGLSMTCPCPLQPIPGGD